MKHFITIILCLVLAVPSYAFANPDDTPNIDIYLQSKNTVNASEYIDAYNKYAEQTKEAEAKINTIQKDIDIKQREINEIQEKLNDNQIVISQFVKWQYKNERNPFFELLLGNWDNFVTVSSYNIIIEGRYIDIVNESQSLINDKKSVINSLNNKIEEQNEVIQSLEESSNKIQELIPDVPVGHYSTVVDAALSRLGCPYVWGATGNSSFDCSGLCMWAINQVYGSSFESQFGRTTWDFDSSMQHISMNELKPGDLVFSHIDNNSQHVGIYIGQKDGVQYCIHAPEPGQIVRIQPMSELNWDSALRYKEHDGNNPV